MRAASIPPALAAVGFAKLRDRTAGPDESGVYVLIEPAEPPVIRYIGSAHSLRRRLGEHNRGAHPLAKLEVWIKTDVHFTTPLGLIDAREGWERKAIQICQPTANTRGNLRLWLVAIIRWAKAHPAVWDAEACAALEQMPEAAAFAVIGSARTIDEAGKRLHRLLVERLPCC